MFRLFEINHRLKMLAAAPVVASLFLMLGGVEAGPQVGPEPVPPVRLSGEWIHSPVALGDINGDGVLDIVVAGQDGIVYAYKGDGALIWQVDTGASGIVGKSAIGDIDNDGDVEVVIPVGSQFKDGRGGILTLDHLGQTLWFRPSGDFIGPGGPPDGVPDGVYSSPSLADVDQDGKLEIVYGGWDAYIYALNHDGTVLWSRFMRDTIWSSPAIGDIDRDGRPEIAIGVDTHREPAFGTEDGGRLYVLNGEDGTDVAGFPIQIDEVIYSSPVLGDIDGDRWLDIVVGTGNCWENPACAVGSTHTTTKALYAWDHNGNALSGWPVILGTAAESYAIASPSLGDLDGDGDLEVVVNTADAYVQAIQGNGARMWKTRAVIPTSPGEVASIATGVSPLIADLTGNGVPEVIITSNWEIVVFDKSGTQLTRTSFPPQPEQWTLLTQYTINNTPAVGDVDNDGQLELLVGGAIDFSDANGAIYIWNLSSSTNSPVQWPAFRRDSQNNARSGLPATLSVVPTSLLMLHAYDDSDSPTISLFIGNEGDGEIAYSITPDHERVSVSALDGRVSSGRKTVDVQVDTRGLEPGTYHLGNITITGMAGSEHVNGSPVTIPVTLYLGNVSRVFLPVAIK